MSTVPAPAAAPVPLPVGRLVSVGAVVFFANAALLVLQLVAGRLLSPFIGSSLETWTAIIGVFLTGIALGNGFGGKLADRYPSPKTLAVLLVLGAVAALWMLLFPQLLTSSGAYKSIPLGPRIPVLAFALCLPAGFVLSLLTPLAIKLGLPDVAHTGRVAGLIFALSTLGCLIGNYVTGFYLIPTFTINTLVLVSAGLLMALAGVTLVVVQPVDAGRPESTEVAEKPQFATGAPEAPAFPDIRKAYLIVFLASFCGMTLELTASRVLAQYLGVSLFTWTGIIGVMLAGTALGNFTGGQLADRPHRTFWAIGSAVVAGVVLFIGLLTAEALGVPVSWWFGVPVPKDAPAAAGNWGDRLSVVVVAVGAVGMLAGLVALRFFRRLPERENVSPQFVLATTLCCAGAATVFLFVAMAGITHYQLFETWGPIWQVIGWTFGMFFLPMFALGLISPQVIRLAVSDVSRAGEVAGRVYAWSTAGAIVGTFAAGYLLLSTLGMYRTLLCAAAVLTLISLLVTNFWKDTQTVVRSDGQGPRAAASTGSGALLYLFSIVLGGVFGGFLLTWNPKRDEGFVAQVESNYYTIKVTRDNRADNTVKLKLTLDHLVHSSVDPYDPEYLYYEHEHIQMEFLNLVRQAAAEPKALVIGGGGYTFPRYAQTLMPESHVDVVEIDPKVTEVAYEHLGLSRDYRNLRAIHMDGRQFVAEKVAPGTYDLVIQDAVNDLSVPAHLMTKEYNDAVKATLRPDGVYLLTIIDSIAYGKLWKAAMATLAKSFPPENVVLLTPEPPPGLSGTHDGNTWDQQRRVLVIYASDKPFRVDALRDAVVERMSVTARFKLASASVHLGAVTAAESPLALAALSALVGAAGAVGVAPDELGWPLPPLGIARYLNVAHTTVVPASRLKRFTDRDPGIVLTDQFCPIDNLMAEVFRQRYK